MLPFWEPAVRPPISTPSPSCLARRYYFYGQGAGPSAALYLVELQLRSDAGTLTATVKSADAAGLPAFLELWNACLTGFLVMG